MESQPTTQREYKDRLFKAIFGRDTEESKRWRLELYNALNGTNFTDPDELEVNTIENVIYITMHNDISFLVDDQMCLYEQQSTFNPNMPLRGFFYFAQLYHKHLVKKENTKETTSETAPKNILSSRLVKIPTPRFFVFYNGNKELPDMAKFRLSDAFITPDKTGDFEWTATVININEDRLKGIHKNCKSLYDYAKFIARVRECAKDGAPTEKQVAEAVDWAIRENLLDGFFKRQRAEVIDLILTEYNEEQAIKTWREDGYVEGLEQGLQEGLEQGAQQKAVEAATNLLRMKVLTPEQIAQGTGLPLDEVLALKEQLAAQPAPAQA